MPSGNVHAKIYKKNFYIIFIPILFFCYYGFYYLSLWTFIGFLLHWAGITPDLDLEGINKDEAKWISSFIFIPLVMWSTMYSRILRKFGSHRGFWSHSLFFSSLIRLLWFGFPFILVFRYFFIDPIYIEFFGMWVGLSIADAFHIIADKYYKE
jgi:uncharacterized metal-binding protein